MANIDDVNLVIEIKSSAAGSDFKKFNDDISKIKQQNHNEHLPLFGMFCYRIKLSKKTVFKRFGFDYDEVNDLLQQQDKVANLSFEYPQLILFFQFIDLS